jgi:hypothetical protein
VARYRRVKVGSSHGDAHLDNSALHTGAAHPDNSTLHTSAVRPHTGFVESLFFISPRTGHGNSQVFEVLLAVFVFRWRVLFLRGVMHSFFSVGPSRLKRGTRVLSRRAGSSGISWRILSLVKRTPHRHRAGFEPQRASPFRIWVKAPPDTRRSRPSPMDSPSLFDVLYTIGGVGELHQRRSVIVLLCRPPPNQDWGRAGALGSRFAREDKELGPRLGEAITLRTAS